MSATARHEVFACVRGRQGETERQTYTKREKERQRQRDRDRKRKGREGRRRGCLVTLITYEVKTTCQPIHLSFTVNAS